MSPLKSDILGDTKPGKTGKTGKTQKSSNMGAPNAKEIQLGEMNEKIIHTLLALIKEPVPNQKSATWRDQNIHVSKPSTGEFSIYLDLSEEQWEIFRGKCIEKLEQLGLKPSAAEVRIEPDDNGKHRMLIDSKALLQTHEHPDTEQKPAPRTRG